MAARKKSTRKVAKPTSAKPRTAPRTRATRKRAASSVVRRKRPAAKAKAVSRTAPAAKAKAAKAAKTARNRSGRKRAAVKTAGAKLALAKSAKSAAKRAAESRVKSETKKLVASKTSGVAAKPSRSPTTGSAAVNPSSKQVEAKLSSKPDERTEAQSALGAKATATAARGPTAAPGGAVGKVPPVPVKDAKPVSRDDAPRPGKPASQRQGFKLNEFVVYPAHGVGQIVAIEEQEVAGFRLELFVISFIKDKMTLRVPTAKVAGVGMRKISDPEAAKRSLEILTGRARIKRTMWSRRAQEYESKINSGDINAIAEVVRDLYRSDAQPEQSYSERQLYEAALDRMVREIAAVQKSNEIDALKAVEAQLQKNQNRAGKAAGEPGETRENEIEEAA